MCLSLKRLVVFGTLPENYSIKHWHNEQENCEYQVHDEANRSPYRAFYVQPAWPNTLKEIVEIVTAERRIHTPL